MSRWMRAPRWVLTAVPIAALATALPLYGPQGSPPGETRTSTAVANCAPASGERPWTDTSRSPDCRAQLALSAMTPEERLSFRGTNERLGLSSPGGSDGPNGVIGGGFGAEQTPVTGGRSANVTAFPTVITLGATWDRDLAGRFGEAVGEEFHGKGMTSVTGPTINLLRTWH